MSQVFALVDCNNFYASCERLFRPDLKGKPVVVLSNNDGCVIARSAEAKALGVKMGVPWFRIKTWARQLGIVAFSSNYALYADISSRVMSLLEELAPRVEVYSIDEAFLDLSGLESTVSLLEFGQKVRHRLDQWVGVRVCVGMAPTKTLAKLANQAAKLYPATLGVVDLTCPKRQRRLLELMPVGSVWGVGKKLQGHLQALGVYSAWDLACYPSQSIRQHFSVVLQRTADELRGISCLDLEIVAVAKKQIVSSRSFGSKVTEFRFLREAVCDYTARATAKLRREGKNAKLLTLGIRTSGFNEASPYYSNSASGELLLPSCDTRDFITLAVRLLEQIFKPGFGYAKASIMLSDFYDPGTFQPELFSQATKRANSKKLMALLDEVKTKDLGSVFFASQGVKKNWAMKREFLSPAYTTRWADLPKVN